MDAIARFGRRVKRRITAPIDEVRWFIQRGRRGWSDKDVWNLDYYLSGLLAESLRNRALKGAYSHKYDSWEEWQDDLNRVADVFENYHNRLWESWYGDGAYDADMAEQRNLEMDMAFVWLSDHFGSLWW